MEEKPPRRPYPAPPPGSEDLYKLKLRPREPVSQPDRAPVGSGRKVGAFVLILLATFFFAVGQLNWDYDPCQSVWSVGPCESPTGWDRYSTSVGAFAGAALLLVLAVASTRVQPDHPKTERPSALQPGWRPDPAGRYEKRYYGPAGWTDHVANIAEKLQTRDPIPVDPKSGKTPSVL